MKLRRANSREILSRMRKGDLPKRRDYASPRFDDDTVAPYAVLNRLIDSGDILNATPHVGAPYTLVAPKASL